MFKKVSTGLPRAKNYDTINENFDVVNKNFGRFPQPSAENKDKVIVLTEDGYKAVTLTGGGGGVSQNTLSSVFSGSQEEYDIAYAAGLIPNGTLVVILDDEENDITATSVLGQAILGQMILA